MTSLRLLILTIAKNKSAELALQFQSFVALGKKPSDSDSLL